MSGEMTPREGGTGGRMPAIYLSHGAPPLADDALWTRQLFDIGRKLAPLRDSGVLIVGSGFFTHNLRAMNTGGGVSPVMAEFDHWGQEVLSSGDIDALLDFTHKAPAARLAHPRTEHFAPLFVTLGSVSGDLSGARTVIDGFWFGLAKRSIEVA
jgi:4,5-DOPA dioxygenase extradiol